MKALRVVLRLYHCTSSNTKTGNAEIIQSSVGANEERPRPGKAEENHDSPKTRPGMSQLHSRRTFTPRRREKSSLEKTLEKITKEWGP